MWARAALRQRMEGTFVPVQLGDARIEVRGPIGIATHQPGEGLDALRARADAPTYTCKALPRQ